MRGWVDGWAGVGGVGGGWVGVGGVGVGGRKWMQSRLARVCAGDGWRLLSEEARSHVLNSLPLAPLMGAVRLVQLIFPGLLRDSASDSR